MIARDAIVSAAESAVGTPYRRQGRNLMGMDCVGLVIHVARRVGACAPGFDFTGYGEEPTGEVLYHVRRMCVPVSRAHPPVGAVLVFEHVGTACHLGVLVAHDPLVFVHAFKPRGAVVRDVLDHNWNTKRRRYLCAFDLPGVDGGSRV